MDSIAIRLRDPSGEYWAQLVNPSETAGRLIPLFVDRLGLPPELNYELADEATGQILARAITLLDAQIDGGASLTIRPVRDSVFIEFLRELYDEAASEARDEMWELVRERLEAIYRVDPQYPDSQQLWRKVASGNGGGGTAAPRQAAKPAAPASEPAPRAAAATHAPSPATRATASRAGRSVFGRLFFLLIIVIIGGGILIYAEVIPEPDWLPDWFPRQAATAADSTTVNGVAVGTGDVRVTLTWNTDADLDLHVTDPRGFEIYFVEPQSPSGGRLDVDANGGCLNDRAVENVFWPTNQAPTGTYEIGVVRYDSCGTNSTRFEVAVYVDGVLVDRHTGTLNDDVPVATLPTFRR